MNRQLMRRAAATAAVAMCITGIATTAHAAPLNSTATATTVHAQVSSEAWADRFNRVVHVRSIAGKCGKTVIAEASGTGMTLRIDETKSLSTSLSKNISASYKAITVAVGWDVTKSRSITVSGSKEVPRGKHGVLTAYTRYSGKQFDVQEPSQFGDKILQRNKKAYKPIGVCFKYTQR
ncbi:hypothetical protein ACFY1L_13765 [Streptomyces sp. NPDC001663]|uniref:hypothetical protein n=1 Tax=Streptomyces sp. NPDC001663 TaxID=3364597 RepID=UPI0036B76081